MVVFTIKSQIYKLLYKMAVKFKVLIIPFVPQTARTAIKKRILKQAYPIAGQQKTNNSSHWAGNGINLIGYARAEMGIGESCRIAAKSLSAAEIPFGIINFTGTNSARMSDTSWMHKEVTSPAFNINLFHINAEQMMEVYAQYGSDIFQNRYNIGYWHWELPDFPDEWVDSFELINEVWVPSAFVADSISMKSPVPVVKIPHSIQVNHFTKRDRSYFNLPEQSFLFLTMYDVKSYQERKNPLAAIEAFKKAFRPDDMSVGLVIKVNTLKANLEELDLLTGLISDYKNIYTIKQILSREDTNALIEATDSYISLHRSEGFGLGLAEAMYLGKPVIGTNWSSNTDFMNQNNSCVVNYKLIPVGTDHGPYKAYQHWANPDVEHAGSFMKRLVTDREFCIRVAANGQETIKQDFSPSAIGELIKKRLKYIRL
ncbi:glycosyltransferase [Paenibacillus filicis]|uniref:Glycosyltransferase n=1 Tax=Paenibacillus gyeongsangnamensis TaxID=3388067 RepID=A0ABT4Q6W7_9BACL|nr:glycosyltransferase [Paenibacillus filicis]MCZ8512541.1 glycosyltransferase [Paenibacillus filicis]